MKKMNEKVIDAKTKEEYEGEEAENHIQMKNKNMYK